MSCEGCPLFGNCPAAQIGGTAFAETVAVEDLAAGSSELPAEFDLLRLAVSADLDSLVAERCAEQLAGETRHNEGRWRMAADTATISSMPDSREQHAMPSPSEALAGEQSLVSILEAGDREAPVRPDQVVASVADRADVRPTISDDMVPEAAVKALQAEGGVGAHVNRYSGRDPSECPMLGSMGRAGVELAARLEVSVQNPNRGKTMGELLAERRAAKQQAADKSEEASITKVAEIVPGATGQTARPETTRLPIEEADRRITLEAVKEAPDEATRPAVTLVEADNTHVPESRQGAEAEAWQRQLHDQLLSVETEATARRSVVDSLPDTVTLPAEDELSLFNETGLVSGYRAGVSEIPLTLSEAPAEIEFATADSLPPETTEVSPIDETRPVVPEVTAPLLDSPYRITAEYAVDEHPDENSRATEAPISMKIDNDEADTPLVNMTGEVVAPESLAAETSEVPEAHPAADVFEAALAEWLAAETPEDEVETTNRQPASVLIGAALSAASHEVTPEDNNNDDSSLVAALQPALAEFQPPAQARIIETLEAISQLGAELGRETEARAEGEAPVELEAAVERFEPLCRQLFDLAGLPSEEVTIRTLARQMADAAAGLDANISQLEFSDIERLNRLGTKEYKRVLAAVMPLTSPVNGVRQSVRQLLALGRYILASAASQPQIVPAAIQR
jgi:hypothetical protein